MDFVAAAEFRAALRRFFRVSENAARRHGLTPRQHVVLLMIQGAPGGPSSATVGELSERMQLAQSTVTELVQRAQAAGFVARRRSDEDGRVAHLRLTPAGLAALGRVHRDLEAERAHLAEALALSEHGR
jgi:DNA-binding MarR family transcriptional regulator